MELSEATKKLISQYALAKKRDAQNPDSPTIHVDEVALRVAAFYEQIRTIVDWKEEHLMRRAAIIRKLKRRFFDLEMNNYSSADGVAESLVNKVSSSAPRSSFSAILEPNFCNFFTASA